jgi:hypothetical protein
MRITALFLLVITLAACGGGQAPSSSPPQTTPTTLTVEGCSTAHMHDSGTIAYVTVERNCPTEKSFTVYFPTNSGVQPVEFAAIGVEQTVHLGSWERKVTVVRRKTWRKFPNTNSWGWRDGAGLLPKDGGLYLLGGWNGGSAVLDVWFTKDLSNWTLVNGQVPWISRHGSGWAVHNNRLYAIGGDWLADVWSSPDGVAWEQHTNTPDFGELYTPNVASLNGELLLFNGMRPDFTGETGVWSSTDGTVWQPAATVPYQGRALIHGVAVFKGRIYVIGGGLKAPTNTGIWPVDTVAEFNDIWSSADGRQWRKEADTLGFKPRTHFSVLGTSHGCYVANGSVTYQAHTTGEVYFAPDCVHFQLVSDPSPMPGVHATYLAEFNGSIVIVGGHGSVVGSTVWQYFPEI